MIAAIKLLLITALASIFLFVAYVTAQHSNDRPAIGASQTSDECSVSAMVQRHHGQLSPVSSSAEAVARAEAQRSKQFADTSIRETTMGQIESKDVLAGRVVVGMRLEGLPDSPLSGPVGHEPEYGHVTCAVALFDADSGDFVVLMTDVEAVPVPQTE